MSMEGSFLHVVKLFYFVDFRKKKKKVADKILPQRVGARFCFVSLADN